jgi:hypothetical protein
MNARCSLLLKAIKHWLIKHLYDDPVVVTIKEGEMPAITT